jgi:hypothetical protein
LVILQFNILQFIYSSLGILLVFLGSAIRKSLKKQKT